MMRTIAFVSTCPPRRCGIATFTADLASAMGGQEMVALDHGAEVLTYGRTVHHVLRTDRPSDFARVAHEVVACGVGGVSVQHEYGIWGPNDGEGVLAFLSALTVPAITTLHTVLRHPSPGQEQIMRSILGMTETAVVMSNAAAGLLIERYGAAPARVAVIPHGVPDLAFVDPDTIKPTFGLDGRRVLLSFGLVGPGKGFETAIEAMPEVVRAVPDATYVILGATHPELLAVEGERYRGRLHSLVADLGVSDNVMFVDRFVGAHELGRWLAAADIFVTPYPNLDQIVSGTLAYALAAGKAVVSTPYLYAAEMLAGGRGRLVPPDDQVALADALVELLHDHGLRDAMARRAYRHGRAMLWSKVAARYGLLFDRLGQSLPSVSRLAVVPVRPVPVRPVPVRPVPARPLRVTTGRKLQAGPPAEHSGRAAIEVTTKVAATPDRPVVLRPGA